MSDAPTFAVSLERRERFVFDVAFDDPGWLLLRLDEPAPLGDGSAPNASRILGSAVGVVIRPTLDAVGPERIARCLELFEDFCVVTQSVREGIDVRVSVEPEGLAVGMAEGG